MMKYTVLGLGMMLILGGCFGKKDQLTVEPTQTDTETTQVSTLPTTHTSIGNATCDRYLETMLCLERAEADPMIAGVYSSLLASFVNATNDQLELTCQSLSDQFINNSPLAMSHPRCNMIKPDPAVIEAVEYTSSASDTTQE